MPERSPKHLRSRTPTPRTRLSRLGLRTGLALALTAPVVVAGVAATSADDAAQSALEAATMSTTDGAEALVDMSDLSARADRASRSAVRVMRPVTMKPRPVDRMWSTAPLNVWTGPEKDAERLRVIPWGTPLAVTGQRQAGRAEVLVGDERVDRWVNARYLAAEKPKPKPEPASGGGASSGSTASTGLSSAPCPDGSDIEGGLTTNADLLYRAVCAIAPELTTYGGLDPHGEHYDGRAVDFMVTSSATGDAVAQYVMANASALRVRSIIWSQRIWTPEQASSGWRYMEDRGSATANHYDHVHVSVY